MGSVGFIVYLIGKLESRIADVGGVQNAVRYLYFSLFPAFTEPQRLKKATAMKITFDRAAEIKQEREKAKIKRENERKAAEKKLVENLSDEVEAVLRKKLIAYLKDESYQIRRDSVKHANILIETRYGDKIASVDNLSSKQGLGFEERLSVYGENIFKNVGTDLGIRAVSKAVLKLVKEHCASNQT